MESVRFMTEFRLAIIIIIMMLLASCAGPKTETERYHRISNEYQPGTGAVTELHREAISALNQGSIQLAIDHLQRAIKIEPRNAFSWHYLAQTYWYGRNYDKCIDMIERSISYGVSKDGLGRANSVLRARCMGD